MSNELHESGNPDGRSASSALSESFFASKEDELKCKEESTRLFREQARKISKGILEGEYDYALHKSRVLEEMLVNRLLTLECKTEPGPSSSIELDKALRALHPRLPRIISCHLNTVQRLGNYGSHSQPDPPTPQDVEVCTAAIIAVTRWYFKHYLNEAIDVFQDSTAPKAEGLQEMNGTKQADGLSEERLRASVESFLRDLPAPKRASIQRML